MKIGQSTDIHQLVEGGKLIIGGVDIPYHKGLLGHSDADVLVHAIAESIIGALGLGDLGKHFPDNTTEYKDIASLEILKEVGKMMKEASYRIGNIDSLVIIEQPKLAPHITQMCQNIARVLDCDVSQINIKATRGEKLGFIGRGEGVAAQAVVLLERD